MKQQSFDFDKYVHHYGSGKTIRVPWQLLWVRDKAWRMEFMQRRYKSQDTLITMVQVLRYLDGR
jgi:tetraacyldisaccharide-1-P 4'-kinase